MDIQASNADILIASAPLTALLATYGGQAAIMSSPIPDDFKASALPALIIDPPVSDEPDDTYTKGGRRVTFNARIYQRPDEYNGGTAPLVQAAEQARKVLRAIQNFAITGGEIVASEVAGPEVAPTSDTAVAGRLLTVRQFIEEA